MNDMNFVKLTREDTVFKEFMDIHNFYFYAYISQCTEHVFIDIEALDIFQLIIGFKKT